MADTRISELTAATAGDIGSNTLIPVVLDSGTRNRKAQAPELGKALGRYLQTINGGTVTMGADISDSDTRTVFALLPGGGAISSDLLTEQLVYTHQFNAATPGATLWRLFGSGTAIATRFDPYTVPGDTGSAARNFAAGELVIQRIGADEVVFAAVVALNAVDFGPTFLVPAPTGTGADAGIWTAAPDTSPDAPLLDISHADVYDAIDYLGASGAFFRVGFYRITDAIGGPVYFLAAGPHMAWPDFAAQDQGGYLVSGVYDVVSNTFGPNIFRSGTGAFSAIIGAASLLAGGDYSAAVGGDASSVSGDYSAAVGGASNLVSGDYSAAVGGNGNTASGANAVVVGGVNNAVSGQFSVVQGGNDNVVEGENCHAIGCLNTTIPGDCTNVVCIDCNAFTVPGATIDKVYIRNAEAGGGGGPVAAADITDATSVGIGLMTAASQSAGRGALGLGTASTQSTGTFAQAANNLSDLASAPTARTSLGLGNSATKNTGTGSGDVATGNHSHGDATTGAAGFMSAADKAKLDRTLAETIGINGLTAAQVTGTSTTSRQELMGYSISAAEFAAGAWAEAVGFILRTGAGTGNVTVEMWIGTSGTPGSNTKVASFTVGTGTLTPVRIASEMIFNSATALYYAAQAAHNGASSTAGSGSGSTNINTAASMRISYTITASTAADGLLMTALGFRLIKRG